MSDEMTLEVTQDNSPAPNNETASSPVEEVKPQTESESPESGKEEKPEKPLTEAEKIRHAMQKRIDRQTAATKAIEERAQKLEQDLQQLRQRAPKESDEPKEEDFESWEDYDKARVEYLADKRAEERLKTEREKELQVIKERQYAETQRQFMEKEAKYKATNPDYDRYAKEAVETMALIAKAGTDITNLRDVVMQFDNPPEMIYQLGKDTTLLEELVTMPPMRIMRELMKLEASLSTQDTTKAPPAPIRPTTPKGGVKPLSKMTGREVLERFKK